MVEKASTRINIGGKRAQRSESDLNTPTYPLKEEAKANRQALQAEKNRTLGQETACLP
jgi:hypothetical protein